MSKRFLEVTYRKGKPLAAYLYLGRKPGDVSVRTERSGAGLVIDYASDGRAIGIEITAPNQVTLMGLNNALKVAGEEIAAADELAPLLVGRAGASA